MYRRRDHPLPGLSQDIGFHSLDSSEFQSDFESKDLSLVFACFPMEDLTGSFLCTIFTFWETKANKISNCVFLVFAAREGKLIFTVLPQDLPGSDTRQSSSHFNDQSKSHSHCLQTNKEVWASGRGKMFMNERAGHWQALLVAAAWAQALLKSSLAQQEKGLGRCMLFHTSSWIVGTANLCIHHHSMNSCAHKCMFKCSIHRQMQNRQNTTVGGIIW